MEDLLRSARLGLIRLAARLTFQLQWITRNLWSATPGPNCIKSPWNLPGSFIELGGNMIILPCVIVDQRWFCIMDALRGRWLYFLLPAVIGSQKTSSLLARAQHVVWHDAWPFWPCDSLDRQKMLCSLIRASVFFCELETHRLIVGHFVCWWGKLESSSCYIKMHKA